MESVSQVKLLDSKGIFKFWTHEQQDSNVHQNCKPKLFVSWNCRETDFISRGLINVVCGLINLSLYFRQRMLHSAIKKFVNFTKRNSSQGIFSPVHFLMHHSVGLRTRNPPKILFSAGNGKDPLLFPWIWCGTRKAQKNKTFHVQPAQTVRGCSTPKVPFLSGTPCTLLVGEHPRHPRVPRVLGVVGLYPDPRRPRLHSANVDGAQYYI